jgi:hypothetical protein
LSRVLILTAGLFALVAGAGCLREDDPLATDPATALGPLEVADAYALLESGSEELPELLQELVRRSDRRFVAVLIEVLRASQLGLFGGAHHNALVVALERLTAQPLGADWFAWVTWYRGTSLGGPPEFAEWKAGLLGRIEPALGDFLRAPGPPETRVEELLWSGNGVDQPAPLSSPRRVPAKESSLDAGEVVVGLAWDGAAIAYPIRYLDWHELVNDRLGDVHYVLAWCALCGSVAVWEAPLDDGRPRAFGPSGLLMRSVRLMYDDATRTLWNELTGRPVLGSEALAGSRLSQLPAVVTRWEIWRSRHPGGSVVELPESDERYSPGNPWGEYMLSAETAYPVSVDRKELPPKTRVFGLESGLRTKAWQLEALLAERVLHDELGGRPILLVAARGPVQVTGVHQRIGELRYTAGAEVRVFARGEHRFRPGADPGILLAEDGSEWEVGDDALHGPAGAELPSLAGTPAFWFAWQAFHPSTDVWP